MQGLDPGAIAQAFITYFGGAAGGYMGVAAGLITWLLAAMHVMSPRSGWITMICFMLAWSVAYIFRTVIGWGA